MMKKYKLTPRQENFCLEYIKTGNASEAYRRSYNTANQKPATINRNAKKLLDNDNIVTRVSEIREPVVKKTEITLEKTLKEIARIAYSDPRKLFDEDGALKPIHELDDDTAACIAGITMRRDKKGNSYVKDVKTWDKNSALEKLGKYFKLFVEQINVNSTGTVIHVHTHCPEPLPLPEGLRGNKPDRD